MRLKPSQKRHRGILYKTQTVQGELGDTTELAPLATVRGSFKKQRGGLVNRETLDISTASASFAIDYRVDYASGIECIEIDGNKYQVNDVTNVDLRNTTLIFDLELNT